MKLSDFTFAWLLLCTSCTLLQAQSTLTEEVPLARNVILMIGSGMGISHLSAAMYTQDKALHIQQFPISGLHKPYAADALIADAAAGASALATGQKGRIGALGLNADGEAAKHLFEHGKSLGYATGLITTGAITSPSTAAFFARVPSYEQKEDIAMQLLGSRVDFFLGGGQQDFAQNRKSETNLLDAMRGKGYFLSSASEQELLSIQPDFNRKFGYFTAQGQPESRQDGRDYLPPATRIATRFLEKVSDKGFLLVISAAQINQASLAKDQDWLISEVLDFDEAVGEALRFAQRDQQTLVIVTAEHEAGGYAIQPGSTRDALMPSFASDTHTAALVPVFAYGPKSKLFLGMYENTAIHHKIKQALGWQP